jgi:hypothetical protein
VDGNARKAAESHAYEPGIIMNFHHAQFRLADIRQLAQFGDGWMRKWRGANSPFNAETLVVNE